VGVAPYSPTSLSAVRRLAGLGTRHRSSGVKARTPRRRTIPGLAPNSGGPMVVLERFGSAAEIQLRSPPLLIASRMKDFFECEFFARFGVLPTPAPCRTLDRSTGAGSSRQPSFRVPLRPHSLPNCSFKRFGYEPQRSSAPIIPHRVDLIGFFCTSGSEREFTLGGTLVCRRSTAGGRNTAG